MPGGDHSRDSLVSAGGCFAAGSDVVWRWFNIAVQDRTPFVGRACQLVQQFGILRLAPKGRFVPGCPVWLIGYTAQCGNPSDQVERDFPASGNFGRPRHTRTQQQAIDAFVFIDRVTPVRLRDQSSGAAPDIKFIVPGTNQMILRCGQYFRQPRLQPTLGNARLYDDHSELNRPPCRQRAHAGFIAAHKSANPFPAGPPIEQPLNQAGKIAPIQLEFTACAQTS